MTTKRTTKKKLAVATEQVVAPTVESLQVQIDNITQQLVYANKRVVELEQTLQRKESDIENYEDLLQSLEDQSWWEITKDKFMTFVYDKTSYFK